ncbi:hypothetical protein VUR80DRAFT_8448 [Thermomyces stellatus]
MDISVSVYSLCLYERRILSDGIRGTCYLVSVTTCKECRGRNRLRKSPTLAGRPLSRSGDSRRLCLENLSGPCQYLVPNSNDTKARPEGTQARCRCRRVSCKLESELPKRSGSVGTNQKPLRWCHVSESGRAASGLPQRQVRQTLRSTFLHLRLLPTDEHCLSFWTVSCYY